MLGYWCELLLTSAAARCCCMLAYCRDEVVNGVAARAAPGLNPPLDNPYFVKHMGPLQNSLKEHEIIIVSVRTRGPN
jgi:hypothetical protein